MSSSVSGPHDGDEARLRRPHRAAAVGRRPRPAPAAPWLPDRARPSTAGDRWPTGARPAIVLVHRLVQRVAAHQLLGLGRTAPRPRPGTRWTRPWPAARAPWPAPSGRPRPPGRSRAAGRPAAGSSRSSDRQLGQCCQHLQQHGQRRGAGCRTALSPARAAAEPRDVVVELHRDRGDGGLPSRMQRDAGVPPGLDDDGLAAGSRRPPVRAGVGTALQVRRCHPALPRSPIAWPSTRVGGEIELAAAPPNSTSSSPRGARVRRSRTAAACRSAPR